MGLTVVLDFRQSATRVVDIRASNYIAVSHGFCQLHSRAEHIVPSPYSKARGEL